MTALAVLLVAAFAAAQDEMPVDVELVLAVDVSLSMSLEEMDLQRRGYAAALSDPAVVEAIAKGIHQRIAVTYLEWAGQTRHRQVIPWRLIASAEDAARVSDELMQSRIEGQRRTSISGAIREAAAMFDGNGFRGLKRVIDVSGDGPNNQGAPVTLARDEVISTGITINGLPLMTNGGLVSSFNIPDLDAYYANCVIGGPAAFVVPVTSWDQFPEALRRKLVLELATKPVADVPKLMRVSDDGGYDCMIGEKLWRRRLDLLGDDL